jgi:hypothetical protein
MLSAANVGGRALHVVAACLLAAPSLAIGQQDVTRIAQSDAEQRREVTITVYNQNFGLVREVRDLTLGSTGRVALEFGDVASQIQPETVHIRGLGDARFDVLEQNYQYDLLNPAKLLEKYVGRTIKVYRYNQATGREEEFDAEVLSVNESPILRIGNEITYNFPGRFAFPEIPENLIAKPTLVWLLDAGERSPRVEVSYLTNNLNWKSDYVLVVNEDDTRGDLTGWVTLTNQSGASYENARLKLVAGDVQRVTPDTRQRMMLDAVVVEAARPGFQEEAFFEYHLYTLERPTTIRQNEQKQVTLLEGEGIGTAKRLIYYGAAQFYRSQWGQPVSNQKIGVYLDIQNTEANRLGMPLPKGIVRVYKADRSGAQQFVGEDAIDHTPRDERIRIKVGEAFDVVGERRQMEYRALGRCVAESSWEIELRNHKDTAEEVLVVEPAGADWEILSSSHPATRVDNSTFTFTVGVGARETVVVAYRIRVRWC